MKNIIEICEKDEAKIIVDSINSYNLGKIPPLLPELWTPINLVSKNKEGQIIGGLLSGIGYWGGLEINILWVHEDYRHNGLGTQLLQKAENIAKSKGAVISILDTFDFQAEGFYIKNEYIIFGKLDNFPKGHKRIYFSKKLSSDS
ncbi:GNAT family N-acetyltransferase [Aquimarina sp. 2201CG5-10]|uniref:GNAT family N-acetyltransferase n=1 Tax=Aquimarina callyspongiae TaxID=3098150 RepID=UPI002AB5A6B6|nr:GNAT family N-acetyltransferase [Aquimarina sp. 2201CG5-10]MDY8135551.1 GNAT family N-acetyltransferase [Aquimarina sp. 2201CG5-10]